MENFYESEFQGDFLHYSEYWSTLRYSISLFSKPKQKYIKEKKTIFWGIYDTGNT